MAGRDEQPGRDVDDWFDEPQPPRGRRGRPDDRRARADAAAPPAATEDDWLDASSTRQLRRPSLGSFSALSDRGRRIVAIVGVLVVLLIVGLAVGGVFSGSSKPLPEAITTTSTSPGTTKASTVSKPPRVAAPAGPLKPGDTGAQVKVLQRALASLGYAPGTIDGSYGTSTQNAVTRFQRASSLTADGVVGSKTLSALRAALASR
jgi:Putative peptidoglycan binding domain